MCEKQTIIWVGPRKIGKKNRGSRKVSCKTCNKHTGKGLGARKDGQKRKKINDTDAEAEGTGGARNEA